MKWYRQLLSAFMMLFMMFAANLGMQSSAADLGVVVKQETQKASGQSQASKSKQKTVTSKAAAKKHIVIIKNDPDGFLWPEFLKEVGRRNPSLDKQMQRTIKDTELLKQIGLKASLQKTHAQVSDGLGSGKGDRSIYDCQNKTNLPGILIRSEGQAASSDKAINNCYQYAGDVREFYATILKRNSIDDKGLDQIHSAHYDKGFNNAFWNRKQMVYGDGDGKIFKFFIERTVIGHELSHGVTQYTCGLNYFGQPGALNEHFSDVIGVVLNQWANKQQVSTDRSIWQVGPGIFADSIHGESIRNMLYPGTAYNDPKIGKDKQPADMAHYVTTYSDNGGVHINSGIMNRCFALFAIKLGGNAWDRAVPVWYNGHKKASSNTNFEQYAKLQVQSAKEMYPNDPSVAAACQEAFETVGVLKKDDGAKNLHVVKKLHVVKPALKHNKCKQQEAA